MSESCDLTILQHEASLKEVVAQLRGSPGLRSRWGQDSTLWHKLVHLLEGSGPNESPSVLLLQFMNNISAVCGSGKAAMRTQFPLTFSRAYIGPGLTERRLYWQIFANLAASFTDEQGSDLDALVEPILKSLPLRETIADDTSIIVFPCLIFVMLVNKKTSSASVKWDLNVVSGVMSALLGILPSWLEGEEEKDQLIGVTKDIILICLTSGIFSRLLHEFEHDAPKESMLLVMLDAVLTSPSFTSITPNGIQFFHSETGKPELVTLSTRLEQSIEEVMNLIQSEDRTAEQSFTAGQRSLKLLDILVTVLSSVPAEQRRPQTSLIPTLVRALIASKTISPITKLGNLRSLEDLPLDDRSFPHLRTYLLMLLAVLVENNWESQEQVRSSGGLAAALECCVIDGNNPFMKERAIVCLRYLLHNNEENQKFVASLEARQVADPDALAQAGYEATITDGKISVKPRAS